MAMQIAWLPDHFILFKSHNFFRREANVQKYLFGVLPDFTTRLAILHSIFRKLHRDSWHDHSCTTGVRYTLKIVIGPSLFIVRNISNVTCLGKYDIRFC